MLVKKVFFRELVSNASKIFIVLVFILPITELFKLLDQAASGNIPTITLVTMMIYGTIASFPMILTIACFLTVVITMNRYCKDQEFAIWLVSGLSPFYWLKQISWFSLPMAIICAASTMYITPWATGKSQEYANFLSKQQAARVISPGLFRENGDGTQVFYVEHYSLTPSLAKRIFIQYKMPSDPTTYNLTAEAGRIDNESGIFSISLDNVSRYAVENTEESNVVVHIKELKASIEQDYKPLDKGQLHIPTSSALELWRDNSTHAKAELSWRISIALMMFVMCFIAVPISIQVGRKQNNLVFILTPIIYAIYENFILTINGYINNGSIPSAAYILIVHFMMLAVAVLLTYIKTFPKGYLFSKNKK